MNKLTHSNGLKIYDSVECALMNGERPSTNPNAITTAMIPLSYASGKSLGRGALTKEDIGRRIEEYYPVVLTEIAEHVGEKIDAGDYFVIAANREHFRDSTVVAGQDIASAATRMSSGNFFSLPTGNYAGVSVFANLPYSIVPRYRTARGETNHPGSPIAIHDLSLVRPR
jgi:hypothetical protein